MHTLYIAYASMMNILFFGLFWRIGMDNVKVYHIGDDTHVHTNSPIFDDYPVPYIVFIPDSFSIYSFVIDFDQSLYAFLDVSPISIMGNVEKGITTKH